MIFTSPMKQFDGNFGDAKKIFVEVVQFLTLIAPSGVLPIYLVATALCDYLTVDDANSFIHATMSLIMKGSYFSKIDFKRDIFKNVLIDAIKSRTTSSMPRRLHALATLHPIYIRQLIPSRDYFERIVTVPNKSQNLLRKSPSIASFLEDYLKTRRLKNEASDSLVKIGVSPLTPRGTDITRHELYERARTVVDSDLELLGHCKNAKLFNSLFSQVMQGKSAKRDELDRVTFDILRESGHHHITSPVADSMQELEADIRTIIRALERSGNPEIVGLTSTQCIKTEDCDIKPRIKKEKESFQETGHVDMSSVIEEAKRKQREREEAIAKEKIETARKVREKQKKEEAEKKKIASALKEGGGKLKKK